MTAPVIDSDTSGQEIAALMAFPTDEKAREAYVLHLDLAERAERGEAVALGPDVLMLMADPNLTYAALMNQAATAMSRGKTAAWELSRQWLAKTEQPPSLVRLRAEYDSLAGKRSKTDRKTFTNYRTAMEPAIHLWMAWYCLANATGMTTERFKGLLRSDDDRRLFLFTATRAAQWLADQPVPKGQAHSLVDTSLLIPIAL